MSVPILSVTLVGTIHGGDGLGVARCTLRRGSRPSGRRPDPHVLAATSGLPPHALAGGDAGRVTERSMNGRVGGRSSPTGVLLSSLLSGCSVVSPALPSSLDRTKRVSDGVSRCSRYVGETVLVLVIFRGVMLLFDGVARLAELIDRASEGVTDAAGEFRSGMPAVVLKDAEEQFRFRRGGLKAKVTLIGHKRKC